MAVSMLQRYHEQSLLLSRLGSFESHTLHFQVSKLLVSPRRPPPKLSRRKRLTVEKTEDACVHLPLTLNHEQARA
jgi:hypothetical protein